MKHLFTLFLLFIGGQVIQPGGGGGGAVSSVFTRTGAVVAATNDYSFSQISGTIAASQLPLPAATNGTSVTFTSVGGYFVCTGTCTITVPVPAAGIQICVQDDVAVTSVITFAAIGSSSRYGNTGQTAYGTAGTGTLISGGAAGDKMCLLGRDSTHYVVASFTGTWVAS